jgi:DNA-binding LacI/PurR family transcriptional regulator
LRAPQPIVVFVARRELSVEMQGQATLRDVAKGAGVSLSTVSRYLKGELQLKPETESRIIGVLEELGYERKVPSAQAAVRSIATIGMIVPQIGNSYFGRIADAAVTAAEGHGFSVLLTSSLNHSRKQLDYVELLVSKQISGLIYVGNYISNPALSAAISSGLPVVVIDEAISNLPPVDTVLVDDYAGAYQATTYLAGLGHRRIAFVSGPTQLHSVRERARGYRDALGKAGIDARSQVQLNGTFSGEFGAGALSRLVAAPAPPTAAFVASDTIALGMMSAAGSLGVSIPETLSIVGFDDDPAAILVSPKLTTIRTPVREMAETGVALLVDRIDDLTRAITHQVTSVALIQRESATVPKG